MYLCTPPGNLNAHGVINATVLLASVCIQRLQLRRNNSRWQHVRVHAAQETGGPPNRGLSTVCIEFLSKGAPPSPQWLKRWFQHLNATVARGAECSEWYTSFIVCSRGGKRDSLSQPSIIKGGEILRC